MFTDTHRSPTPALKNGPRWPVWRRVGSLALGKVHLQVLLLQLQAIRKELADTVMTEQVIRPLVELNFGPGEVPRFEFEEVGLEAFVSGSV